MCAWRHVPQPRTLPCRYVGDKFQPEKPHAFFYGGPGPWPLGRSSNPAMGRAVADWLTDGLGLGCCKRSSSLLLALLGADSGLAYVARASRQGSTMRLTAGTVPHPQRSFAASHVDGRTVHHMQLDCKTGRLPGPRVLSPGSRPHVETDVCAQQREREEGGRIRPGW